MIIAPGVRPLSWCLSWGLFSLNGLVAHACASSRQQAIGTLATSSMPEKRRFFFVENIEILRE